MKSLLVILFLSSIGYAEQSFAIFYVDPAVQDVQVEHCINEDGTSTRSRILIDGLDLRGCSFFQNQAGRFAEAAVSAKSMNKRMKVVSNPPRISVDQYVDRVVDTNECEQELAIYKNIFDIMGGSRNGGFGIGGFPGPAATQQSTSGASQ